MCLVSAGAHGDQTRAWDPLERELQVAVSVVLGTELRSSERAV